MPVEPVLRSFQVDGFRAIRHVEIPELRRVNLFVGKNNAGKTSLLEAIRLYLHRSTRAITTAVYEIVREHTDHRPVPFSRVSRDQAEVDPSDLQLAVDAVESLFNGSFDGPSFGPIRLRQGSAGGGMLTIRLPWSVSPNASHDGEDDSRPLLIDPDAVMLELRSEETVTQLPVDWFIRRVLVPRQGSRSPAVMIGSSGLSSVQTRQMWDRVALAGQEALVEEALRPMVPDLERILLIGEGGSRSILLKLKGVPRPVPMQGMGDGVKRVFGIAVSLILAAGGALLIDEVENGVHYSIQDEVWDSIFSLARRFGVQVFATTHSWDAVLGFQYAAGRSDGEGMLYRLERQPDSGIETVAFTDADVAIAARHDVEIR